MSVTLKSGGVSATTGGTDQVFTRTNATVTNGNEYSDVSEANFFSREKVIIVTRQPQLQSDGTWSKQKISARYTVPKTRADGTIAYNVGRSEVEYDPETTPAEVDALREYVAQMAISAVLDPTYTAGTLPV